MSTLESHDSSSNGESQPKYSMSDFFHDAYDKGVVNTVTAHHKEAAIAAVEAVGVVAAITAVTCLTDGRALTGLFNSGVAGEASALVVPPTEGVLGRVAEKGCEITASTLNGSARSTVLNAESVVGRAATGVEGLAGSNDRLISGARLSMSSRFVLGSNFSPENWAKTATYAEAKTILDANLEAELKRSFGTYLGESYAHVPFPVAASAEGKAAAIMDAATEPINGQTFEGYLGEGYTHVPFSAAASAESKATAIMDGATESLNRQTVGINTGLRYRSLPNGKVAEWNVGDPPINPTQLISSPEDFVTRYKLFTSIKGASTNQVLPIGKLD